MGKSMPMLLLKLGTGRLCDMRMRTTGLEHMPRMLKNSKQMIENDLIS
jgi:hypothetical protein